MFKIIAKCTLIRYIGYSVKDAYELKKEIEKWVESAEALLLAIGAEALQNEHADLTKQMESAILE